MKISKQARQGAKALFRSCRINEVLDEGRVRRAVQALVTQKPRGYLALLTHFHRLIKLELDRRSARVESAQPLEPLFQGQLQDQLLRRYGAGMTVGFSSQPALIGGLRLQVGSDVYDGSIRARLDALAESF
jgi:F-type H+-transporting ATPase subunit delta